MIDYNETLVTNLSTILPTYYELFCDATTPKPCITYLLNSDVQDATGDTFGYSKVKYYIKLWGDDLSVINPKCQLVDSTMRSLGFKRTSTNDLVYDNHICKIFTYEGLAIEQFEN